MGKDNVYQLGAHERMTVEEALAQSTREADEYESVLIVAVEKETKNLIVRSSALTREAAAWLSKRAELHAHGILGEDE